MPVHTAETLRKLKFDVMAHPSYRPDLAPFDYHLFGPLKVVLRGRRFTSNEEVKDAVMRDSLQNRKPSFRKASGSLCNDGPSKLKNKRTVLKNDVNASFLFVLQ